MRAFVYSHNSKEGVREIETPYPKLPPKKGLHVLVKVNYCGVNPVDAKYNLGDKLPTWLNSLGKWSMDGQGVGYDFSGIIMEPQKVATIAPFPQEMRFLELCHQCMVVFKSLFWLLSIKLL